DVIRIPDTGVRFSGRESPADSAEGWSVAARTRGKIATTRRCVTASIAMPTMATIAATAIASSTGASTVVASTSAIGKGSIGTSGTIAVNQAGVGVWVCRPIGLMGRTDGGCPSRLPYQPYGPIGPSLTGRPIGSTLTGPMGPTPPTARGANVRVQRKAPANGRGWEQGKIYESW